MPIWDDLIRSKDEYAASSTGRDRPRLGTTACLVWDCGAPIRSGYLFCLGHYQDHHDGAVDRCPGCGRGKYSQFSRCLECQYDPQRREAAPAGRISERHGPEYSAAWEAGDATARQFYVYILKLTGGRFYVGQTRELKERLGEHKDGAVPSTTGQNPRLAWFHVVPTRHEAVSLEAELKDVAESNQREIRRLVVGFRDLVREVDLD